MINEEKFFCVPGDILCKSDDNNLAGTGTYVYKNYIYAAISGLVNIELNKEEDTSKEKFSLQHRTINVTHNKKVGFNKVPTVGVIVTCKVISINSTTIKCRIYCIENNILKLPFKGYLRKEEIRSKDKDFVEVHKNFRPRDIILARVIGLSDQGYMLTTAEDELGVVIAYSESGKKMIPISWNECICPDTYIKEERKIAKVLTEEDKFQS